MARIETDPNYSTPTFPRATAATDLFKKEDVQALAAAMSTHTHAAGKGAAIESGAIPNGTITSAMIADGTIVAGDIADGAVTSAKILDGTIATGDLADSSVTIAKLATDAKTALINANTNLLVNGGMEFWARGGGPFTSSSFYTADGWRMAFTGSTAAVYKNTAWLPTPPKSGSSLQIVFTYSGGFAHITQKLDPSLVQELRGHQITLTAWVAFDTPGMQAYLDIECTQGGHFNSAVFTGPVGTFARLSATATVPSNESSITIQAIVNNASGNVFWDNLMLVLGSVPVDYIPLHHADEQARCDRYYEVLGDGSTGSVVVSGIATGASGPGRAPYRFRARKIVSPTITKVGTWAVGNCGQPSLQSGSQDGFYLTTVSTAAGDFYALNAGGGAYITAEAIP
jgi:hypothetical protein